MGTPVMSTRTLWADQALQLEELAAHQWWRIGLHQLRQLAAQGTLAVHGGDGLAQRRIGDLPSQTFLQLTLQTPHRGNPVREGGRVPLLLRELEHVHGDRLPEELVHLLLAVASRLRHEQVGHLEEGIGTLDVVAVGGLDEGAEVRWEVFLGGGDGAGIATAEADGHSTCRHDELPRGVLAEDSHDAAARLLFRAGMLQATIDHPVEPGQRGILPTGGRRRRGSATRGRRAGIGGLDVHALVLALAISALAHLIAPKKKATPAGSGVARMSLLIYGLGSKLVLESLGLGRSDLATA
jgi:hypothetical protein